MVMRCKHPSFFIQNPDSTLASRIQNLTMRMRTKHALSQVLFVFIVLTLSQVLD